MSQSESRSVSLRGYFRSGGSAVVSGVAAKPGRAHSNLAAFACPMTITSSVRTLWEETPFKSFADAAGC
jgi:hypothetical protein